MRKFEWGRKSSKKQPTSKENITIIRALNNFGRAPEQYELLDEIERLQQELQRKDNIIKELDNMFYETFKISQDGYFSISEWELKDFTDKIKELEKM